MGHLQVLGPRTRAPCRVPCPRWLIGASPRYGELRSTPPNRSPCSRVAAMMARRWLPHLVARRVTIASLVRLRSVRALPWRRARTCCNSRRPGWCRRIRARCTHYRRATYWSPWVGWVMAGLQKVGPEQKLEEPPTATERLPCGRCRTCRSNHRPGWCRRTRPRCTRS